MENFTLIPATDPLCQELQRGHNSYSDGAVICKMRHILDKTGEWLVGPIPDAPNPNEPWANVHPGDNYKAIPAELIDPSGMSPRMNIYFIRMWTRACKECGTAVTYKDNYYNMCTQCGDAQTEGGA
jgi:hypothetical protein|tara:strand:- start:516 stop:893 length:378 start_codon:yes stop_codon:yes gene_type:complete